MRRLLVIAVALFAISLLANTSSAQTYDNAYRFGSGFAFGVQNANPGFRHGNQFGFRGFRPLGTIGVLRRVQEPPYFAQQPPVYYSGIVRRPYGVSPFAAPPGIVPVEMTVQPAKPVTINNPYFENQAAPVSQEQVDPDVNTDNKTTSIINPYTGSLSHK